MPKPNKGAHANARLRKAIAASALCFFALAASASADVHRPGQAYVPGKWIGYPKINTDGGVKDFKAIKQFSIPPHWEGGTRHRLARDAYEFRWNREGEKYVELKVRIVLRPASESARQKLKAIFAKKPHRLAAPEIKAVEAVLASSKESKRPDLLGYEEVQIVSAETKDIDGIRVLVYVSGREVSGTTQEAVLIPLDEKFPLFQEVLYCADSESKFETYRKEAEKSLTALRLQRP